jgi:3-methylcrotonyl-CoA carboxylase alpha subunit
VAHIFQLDGADHHVWIVPQDDQWHMIADGKAASIKLTRQHGDSWHLIVNGRQQTVVAIVEGDTVHVHLQGETYALRYRDPVELYASEGDAASVDVSRAPMPGIVLSTRVEPGTAVRSGETLMLIESMKMEMAIRAGHHGVVEAVHVAPGQNFDRDAALVTVRRNEV